MWGFDFTGRFLEFVPLFLENGAVFRDRLVSEGLCLDPRVKPEDDDLLGWIRVFSSDVVQWRLKRRIPFAPLTLRRPRA
ncbi:hypothetical protein C0V73_15400 [Rhizobium sp. TH135]|nr:hypothetical protein C0V73_15400 [Rhizobium sp. TH135]